MKDKLTENNEISSGKLKGLSPDVKGRLTKLKELIGFITATIALCSIIITIISKYISLGRCLFFDFDFNYYDFSIMNTGKYMFILSVVAGIISIIMSFIFCAIWNLSISFINKRKFKKRFPWNWLAGLSLIIIFIFLSIILSFYFIPEFLSSTYFCIIILVCSYAISSFLLFQDLRIDVIKEKIIIWSVAALSKLVFFASLSMRYEYKQAMEQKTFPIITENGGERYVVISQSKEEYSAYLCEFKAENEKDVLIIRKDAHKYFNISDTKIIKVEFDKVERLSTESLSVNEFLTKQAH